MERFLEQQYSTASKSGFLALKKGRVIIMLKLVVGIAWAVPDDNVFYRISVSYIGESYKFEFIIQKYLGLGSSNL